MAQIPTSLRTDEYRLLWASPLAPLAPQLADTIAYTRFAHYPWLDPLLAAWQTTQDDQRRSLDYPPRTLQEWLDRVTPWLDQALTDTLVLYNDPANHERELPYIQGVWEWQPHTLSVGEVTAVASAVALQLANRFIFERAQL